jgi:peptidyl-prolyl cis-trans isomerase A (cyclophilin A)
MLGSMARTMHIGGCLMAVLHTTLGDIRLTLFTGLVPRTVANFVGLAQGSKHYTRPNCRGGDSGPFYDGTIFHRVIKGAWITAGDPTCTGQGHPGYWFGDEFHADLRFDRPYRVAMANFGPGTNGSQFFITLGPQPRLDFHYPIFGEVADKASQSIVDSISQATTGRGDRPLTDVVVERVEIEPADADGTGDGPA